MRHTGRPQFLPPEKYARPVDCRPHVFPLMVSRNLGVRAGREGREDSGRSHGNDLVMARDHGDLSKCPVAVAR